MAKIPFHGIVAVGNTKQEAIVQYRALAKGKSATPYVDKAKSLSFVSNSSVLAHVFNPMTGNMDMTEAPKLAKLLEFASESSAENRDVNHYECKSGCGGHIVYDSDSLLKFCPVCTTSISEDAADSDEDLDEDLDIDSEDEADEDLDAESKSTSKSKKSKSADDAPAADADADAEEDEAADDEEDESDDEDEEAESKSKAIPAVLKKVESKAKKFAVKTITASDDVMDSDDTDADAEDEELDSEADEDLDVDAEGDEEVAAESKSKTSKSAVAANKRLKKSLSKSKRKSVSEDDVDLGDVQGAELTSEDDEDEEEIPGDLPDAEDQLDDPIVVAGSTKAEALQMFIKERPVTAAKALDVEYKLCSSKKCGAHILSESASISACPACDSKLLEPKSMSEDEEIDLGEEDTDDSDDDQDLDMDLDIEDTDGDEDLAEAGDEELDESVDLDADADAEEDEADAEEEAVESTSKAKTKVTVKKTVPAKKFAKLRAVSADEEMSEDPAEEDFDDTEDMLDGDEDEDLDVDAMDMVDEDAEGVDEAMDVSYSSSINGKSQWTAWYKGIPVAVCTASQAGKNADIFDTQDFGRAIHVSMKHAGVKNTLREMGFKPITTTVALSSSVQKRVSAKVAEAKAKLVQEKKEYSERLNAALATSAIGLTRGFFTDLQNPLKAQLHQAMSTAGIRNPEVLIHQAFKQSADQYHKVLFDKAQDILSKPSDVQESLAKAVLETNYMESSSSAPNATEERLASMGTAPVSTSSASDVVKSDSTGSKSESGSFSEMASRVVSSLGRGKGRW